MRTAVAPVAHALATLYTGMPVWPICFCSCWPTPAIALNEASRAEHVHVVDRDAAVGQRAASRLRSRGRSGPCRCGDRTWSCTRRGSRRCRRSSSCPLSSSGSKAKAIASVPSSSVPATNVVMLHRHPELHVLGIGLDVEEVAPSPSRRRRDRRAPTRTATGTPGTVRWTIVNDRTTPCAPELAAPELGAAGLGVGVAPVEVRARRSRRTSHATRCGSPSSSTR